MLKHAMLAMQRSLAMQKICCMHQHPLQRHRLNVHISVGPTSSTMEAVQVNLDSIDQLFNGFADHRERFRAISKTAGIKRS